jgi:hypothetical protein
LLTCPRSFLCNVQSKLSGNFSRGERGRDIFDFTAARTETAKTEKEMKSLVKKKEQPRLFSFKNMRILLKFFSPTNALFY